MLDGNDGPDFVMPNNTPNQQKYTNGTSNSFCIIGRGPAADVLFRMSPSSMPLNPPESQGSSVRCAATAGPSAATPKVGARETLLSGEASNRCLTGAEAADFWKAAGASHRPLSGRVFRAGVPAIWCSCGRETAPARAFNNKERYMIH